MKGLIDVFQKKQEEFGTLLEMVESRDQVPMAGEEVEDLGDDKDVADEEMEDLGVEIPISSSHTEA